MFNSWLVLHFLRHKHIEDVYYYEKCLGKMEGKHMAVSYKKMWKLLIDKNMNKGELCHATGICAGTMAKMSKDEPVTLTVLAKICDVLNCDIGDVVEKIPEQIEQEGNTSNGCK